MLYRKIERQIEEHLRSDSAQIMLVDGARQVGKTYIIRHVGQRLFENFIEVNMVEDSLGSRLFADTGSVEDFYLQLSMLAGNRMKSKENTLVFIDEIQEYPRLLTLLKFLAAVRFWELRCHRRPQFPLAVFVKYVCFPWILKNFSMPAA